jgi:hypothetical protein
LIKRKKEKITSFIIVDGKCTKNNIDDDSETPPSLVKLEVLLTITKSKARRHFLLIVEMFWACHW